MIINQTAWQKIFLWWPVKINTKWVWLKSVYYRTRIEIKLEDYPHGKTSILVHTEFGTLFDVLKSPS